MQQPRKSKKILTKEKKKKAYLNQGTRKELLTMDIKSFLISRVSTAHLQTKKSIKNYPYTLTNGSALLGVTEKPGEFACYHSKYYNNALGLSPV